MPAGIHNITIEQGATWSQTFTWKVNGNPVDLTGYKARLYVRQASYNTILALTTELLGGITLNRERGAIDVLVGAQDTSSILSGKHAYDLEVESSGGYVTRLLKGTFYVSAEVQL
jgi:hypothetical protein